MANLDKKKNRKESHDSGAQPAKRYSTGEFRIGFHVHDVSRMRRTLFDKEMRPLDLTRSQWWVLAQLSRADSPDGVLQTELARILEVGKVTIGGLIDRLEESGFVERRPDSVDRRAKRIVITRSGYKVLDRMILVGRRLDEKIFKGIPREKLEVADSVLVEMKKNIRNLTHIDGKGGFDSDDEDMAD